RPKGGLQVGQDLGHVVHTQGAGTEEAFGDASDLDQVDGSFSTRRRLIRPGAEALGDQALQVPPAIEAHLPPAKLNEPALWSLCHDVWGHRGQSRVQGLVRPTMSRNARQSRPRTPSRG